MPEVTAEDHRQAAQVVRELLAIYRDHEDLISIGAYRRGSNPAVDTAIEMQEQLHAFLRQRVSEQSSVEEARAALLQLRQRAAQRLHAAASHAPQGNAGRGQTADGAKP